MEVRILTSIPPIISTIVDKKYLSFYERMKPNEEKILEIQKKLEEIAVELSQMWSVFETWSDWRNVRFEFDWPLETD